MEFKDESTTTQSQDTNCSASSGENDSNSRSVPSNHLPKLSLPSFNGDIAQWQSFWDSYEAAIHLNQTLSDVQKFSYLRSLVQESASTAIAGFPLTNANYQNAIDVLRERFGQSHKIIDTYMQSLLNLPVPNSNVSSLHNFHDQMESYIRGLESLGQCQNSYGDLLVPIIMKKLPSELRRNLSREHGNKRWHLQDLRTAITREISILESGETDDIKEPHIPTASLHIGTKRRYVSREHTHTTLSDSSKSNKPHVCQFCGDQHSSINCENVKTAKERHTIVKSKRLCYNCLGKHKISDCRSKFRCRNCQQKHHTSICILEKTPTSSNAQPEVPKLNPEAAAFHSMNQSSNGGVLLKTAVTEVCSPDITQTAAILLDEGAQKSFITKKLADELQLPVEGVESIKVSTFGGNNSMVQQYERATIYLKTDGESNIPVHVLIVPTIASPMDNRFIVQAASLPYLRDLKLAHPVSSDSSFLIDILIGADHYWDIVQDDIIRGNGPTAVGSKIGYLLSGPIPTSGSGNQTRSNHIMNVVTPNCVDESLERFWNLESIGINATEPDQNYKEYLADYQQTSIDYTEGRYHAMLPWKQEHPPLPTNFDITLKRTLSTVRRLRDKPEMLKKYSAIIDEQEKRGFIEKVSNGKDTPHGMHYIPHHPIQKESSTTPIRIVYDCSCRQSRDHPSLNDCLESVPPVLNDLSAVLVRFRQHEYAVTTDIEKAFLHVGLHEKDRDMTRFLWFEDPFDIDSPLVTYRFKSVLFGATCSPFILNATLLKHLNENSSVPAATTLARDLYVDNVVSSFKTESGVVTYFREARNLLSHAGMNLRSWTSNSKELLEVGKSENVLDDDDVIKVLGMRWNPTEDTMTFQKRNIPVLDVITKRSVLKYTAQIFDPLGILSPITVRAKLLMQELWSGNYDWDTPLPQNIQSIWSLLAADLNRAMDTTFRRHLLQTQEEKQTGSDNTTDLHIFVDASVKAYGAVAYVSNNREARLIMAKNRVAPLKTLTLPRLELMATVIGSRLGSHLQSIFPSSRITFWSDSQIVLYWLSATKPLKRFVANRVKEIQAVTKSYHWKYCPTNDNPADLSSEEFQTCTLWETGPKWLQQKQMWPSWEASQQSVNVTLEDQPDEQNTKNHCDIGESPASIQNAINIDRFSSYRKLLRVTAFVIRFVKNCKRMPRIQGSLTHNEIRCAEGLWIRDIQNSEFADEIASLKSGSCRRMPVVRQLQLFVDEQDHLQCGGRIHNAPVTDAVKFPLLLPKKHRCTQLIVEDAHARLLHAGASSTITFIRQKYWIPCIRQNVKAILRKCTRCKKIVGKPYSAPDPPPLPKNTVSDVKPFTYTGVDFSGALLVRDNNRNDVKAYVCLFTCATTRAVHLELVPDLSTESFLQAFRRFCSRKSVPQILMSDNANTFISASRQLQDLFQSMAVREELNDRGVEWKTIPKRAPWFGGMWERLIGLTKTTIKKVLGRSYVNYQTLQTVLTEIEAMINDRPLTYVTSDISDEPEILTPSHLLYGRRINSLPYERDTATSPDTIDRPSIINRATLQKTLINHFRVRWRREYLAALRERHQATGRNDQNISVGDIVLVHDDTSCLLWKLAVIEELVPGKDGLIRSAKIRTQNGYTNRPIAKLYPLEVS